MYVLFIPLVIVLFQNVAYSEDLFPNDISGTYHNYAGEIKLHINVNGTFTLFNKTTNVLITGSWEIKSKDEIIFHSPNSTRSSTYQIYGKHLFQNGYLAWRKNE